MKSSLLDTFETIVTMDTLDPVVYLDGIDCLKSVRFSDMKNLRRQYNRLRDKCYEALPQLVAMERYEDAREVEGVLRQAIFIAAPYDFEDWMLGLEFDRPVDKRFYRNRRHYLKPYVEAYQQIMDGELDFLSCSMPKRSGKSTLGILFIDLMINKFPDKSILAEGTGDDLIKSFYNGVLEYQMPETDYNTYQIFPQNKIIQTNADTKVINLNHKTRFPSLMCRSIDARQVGLSEASSLLYLDDCVEGREEAKNRQRLDEKWEVISGDVLGRALEGTPVVICGTRYSLYDPIGRLQDTMKDQGKRMKILEIPALDPITDESNFEFEYGGQKYFTTQYFRDQRTMLSEEQWESEFQQKPFEAKGLLFPTGKLNYYYELPHDVEPDSIIAVVDTAESGSDFCSMPIGAIYGEDVYITDVMFDDSPSDVTKPECAKKLIDNQVASCTFESNLAGEYYARDVADLLRLNNYDCGIRTKRTISNKQTRIEFAADMIIKHFWFKAPSTYSKTSQYAEFMKQLTTYTRSGKVAHDDSADSLSLLCDCLRKRVGTKVQIIERPF